MDNKLQVSKSSSSIVKTEMNQYGDGSTQIANVSNFHNYQILSSVVFNNDGIPTPKQYECNPYFFNLFVIESQMQFKDNNFEIAKESCLTKYIERELKDKHLSLNNESIKELKSYPCIFASKNLLSFGKTEDTQFAYFGFVDDIHPLDKTIKFSYHMISPIKQNELIKIMNDLKIKSTSMKNEFDETHWTLKDVNIFDVFSKHNINYLPFKITKEEEKNNE